MLGIYTTCNILGIYTTYVGDVHHLCKMLGTYTTCGGIEHSRAGGAMPQQQVVQIQCGVPPAELPGRALGKAWHAPKCSPHLAFGGGSDYWNYWMLMQLLEKSKRLIC